MCGDQSVAIGNVTTAAFKKASCIVRLLNGLTRLSWRAAAGPAALNCATFRGRTERRSARESKRLAVSIVDFSRGGQVGGDE